MLDELRSTRMHAPPCDMAHVQVVLGELHSTPEVFKGLGPHAGTEQRQQQQQGLPRAEPRPLQHQGQKLKGPLRSHDLDWGELAEASPRSDTEQQQQQQQQRQRPLEQGATQPLPLPVLGQAAPGLVALPPAARNMLIAAAVAPLPYYANDSAEVRLHSIKARVLPFHLDALLWHRRLWERAHPPTERL